MPIISKDNLIVKEARQLKITKNRKATGNFLAEGPHLVGELLRSDFRIERIFIDVDHCNNEHVQLTQQAIERSIPIVELAKPVFKTLCETENPQGILAVAQMKAVSGLPDFSSEKWLVLIADRIQDPGNLGTLFRTAWGFGVNLCIKTPGTVDIYNAKVMRSSMGGIFHLPVVQAEPEEIRIWAEKQRLTLFAGDPSDRNDLHQVRFPNRTGIIVGNEGSGLSQDWIASESLRRIYIPMPGQADSLNVTIAASIILYEASGQILLGN